MSQINTLLLKIKDAWENYERMGEVATLEGHGLIHASTLEEIYEAAAAVDPNIADTMDPWEDMRADVLHGVDGLDNDQVNIVLGIIDQYMPENKPRAPEGERVAVGVFEYSRNSANVYNALRAANRSLLKLEQKKVSDTDPETFDQWWMRMRGKSSAQPYDDPFIAAREAYNAATATCITYKVADAEGLYTTLRGMHWSDQKLAVIKSVDLPLGLMTYSGPLLDEAIRKYAVK